MKDVAIAQDRHPLEDASRRQSHEIVLDDHLAAISIAISIESMRALDLLRALTRRSRR